MVIAISGWRMTGFRTESTTLWQDVEMPQESAPKGPPQPIQLPVQIKWPQFGASDTSVATHFALIGDGEESGMGMYLLVGQLPPPMWLDDEARKRGIAESGGVLHVELDRAYFITRARALELYNLLKDNLGLGGES